MSVQPDEQVDISKTDARAGSTPGYMRYVLAISLVLVVIALLSVLGVFTS